MVVGLGVAKFNKLAPYNGEEGALSVCGLNYDPLVNSNTSYTSAFKFMTTKKIKQIVSRMIKEGDYASK